MKFDNEIVSVIIPTYNSEKYLINTIESVINQSYKTIEIVIVDDCSIDNSSTIINNFIINNKIKIIYKKLEKNDGVANARNVGIQIASGRFIAFLDSDDIWKNNKLEKQISLLKRTNCGMTYCAIEYIDDLGEVIKQKRKVKEKISYSFLLKNTMIATSSVVIDRNIIETIHMPIMRVGEDYSTWLTILKTGIVANGINEALISYRVHNNSLSSNKFNSIKMLWNVQRKTEGLNTIHVIYDIICYAFNAVKKHYF